MKIKMAKINDKEEIIEIYKSLIGSPGCTWSDEYPTLEDIERDINNESLYVVCDDKKIIAVAAAGKDNELEHLECWNKEIKMPCDLAKIGVIREYQGKGIAKILVKYIEQDILKRGFDGEAAEKLFFE